jgi:MFS superfamily sulfate permease-like transporter
MPWRSNYNGETFWQDLLASVVVFLVALPLCIGIAIASGLPEATGIITGVIGGLLVGSLAGAPLQVSGPAAGLVVIVSEIVRKAGVEQLGIIIILAGAFQMIGGRLGLGQWFRAVPPAVVYGMLSGIGLIILTSQVHVMLDDTPKAEPLANLIAIPYAIWSEFAAFRPDAHHVAGLIGISTIAIIIIWDKFVSKRFRAVPGALVAIVTVTTVDAYFGLPIKHVHLPENLFAVISLPQVQSVTELTKLSVYLDALALAFIASCESMLTCSAVDRMGTGHRTKYDREMQAQGVGNVVCGALGVLPMTGVIVRSGVNVKAGARTRLSTILHGAWLLIFVSGFPRIVELIPISSLAALLVLTGYKLLTSTEARELKKYGKSEVLIWAATLGSIFLIDLLVGVLIGVILSVIKMLYLFSHLEIRVTKNPEGNDVTMTLSGAATFLTVPKLASALDELPEDATVYVRLEGLDYLDHACLELLACCEKSNSARGGKFLVDWTTLDKIFECRQHRPIEAKL